MKKLIAMLLALVMLLALCACGQTAAPAEQSTAAPAENPTADPSKNRPMTSASRSTSFSPSLPSPPTPTALLRRSSRDPRVHSGGNMTVECYDSGTLYGQDTEHDALKNGDVDMIYSSASWLTDGSPWISMFTAGYVFQSYDHMTKVLNGDIGKDMFQKVAEEQGILPLGAFYLGTRQISLSQDKQIKTPEDLKGINLRMPNSDAWVFLGKAMGANPTAVGFNDLYLALQTGTVDGQDNPLPTVKSAKFYEVQESISLTNHLVDSVWPTINLNTWNKLTDTQKGWVMEAVEAARVACDEQNIKTESEVQDFLREQGLTIYEADVAAFADHVLETYLADPISDTWDKDLLAQIQAMA